MTSDIPEPHPTLNCVVCSASFRPKHPAQKTCSTFCRERRFRTNYPTIKCVVCDKEFKPANKKVTMCSAACRNKKWKPERETFKLGIPCATVGAVAELMVAVELFKLGYEVYRPLSFAASCDLIALKDGIIFRIEVKTARYAGDKLVHPVKNIRSENLVLVTHSDQKAHMPPELIPMEKEFKWTPQFPIGSSPIPCPAPPI